MAFKRKGGGVPAEPAPTTGDVKIVDELVKKSLAINPGMRRGQDTQEILERLRAEAVGSLLDAEKTSPSLGGESLPVPKRKHQDPRLQTLFIFMEQKTGSLPQAFSTLTEQRRAIEQDYQRKLAEIKTQEQATRREVIAEVVDLVRVLMGSGAKPHDCQQALMDFRSLLTLLDINAAELVRMAQGK